MRATLLVRQHMVTAQHDDDVPFIPSDANERPGLQLGPTTSPVSFNRNNVTA